MHSLHTGHGDIPLPAFLPDATRGAVRALDALDVADCGIKGIMVNALHLSSRPGASVISALGGIHRFTGWKGPIVSDSGGFQVYSLVSASSKMGSVSDQGFIYKLEKGQDSRKLTPERCIQKQFQMRPDIIFCLDHCTHPNAALDEQRVSVEHTVEWARRGKDELVRLMNRPRQDSYHPLLFAVIQGGSDRALRRACAERLLDLGFDGFGYGGWPINDEGGLVETIEYVAELVPKGLPRHALGIGKPENVVNAYRSGYDLFDCAIPTRDARHRRLYVFAEDAGRIAWTGREFYQYVYIHDERYTRDGLPVEEGCDCACCRKYTRAYLHHLFKIDDHLAYRLATIHNLRFYTRLMERLRTVPTKEGAAPPGAYRGA